MSRRIAANFSEGLIRRAVKAIQDVYGADLRGAAACAIRPRCCSGCRQLKDAEDRSARERRSVSANQAQDARWDKMPEELRQRFAGMLPARKSEAAAPATSSPPAAALAIIESPQLIRRLCDDWMGSGSKHIPAETRDY